jgi:hypothetical protein
MFIATSRQTRDSELQAAGRMLESDLGALWQTENKAVLFFW